MSLEEAGVPTIAVHTHVFERLAMMTARTNGMPTTRQAFVPQPIVGKDAADLRAYIEGEDPVSGRPFVQEVIEGLTGPLTGDDITGLTFERSTPRLLEPDSEENLHQLFLGNNWTDKFPIVLPTEERVEAMLKGTARTPDEVVGKLRPAAFREFWEVTVEKVAVNAVMAGAKPEYLPVILALVASGITARSSSTTSFSTMSVINGPIRGEIGMNDGLGALGPYNHANSTIGRAYSLASQNGQGGSVPGETYMGSVGNGLSYSFTFPEAEERSPWVPLHVQKGFKPDDSTAAVFLGGWYKQSYYGPRDHWQERFRRCLTASEVYCPPLIVMDPIAAEDFVKLGFDTKEKLIEWCSENAKVPAQEYWDDQFANTLHKPWAVAGTEPYATRLKAQPDEMISAFEPDEINIVVTGGESQPACFMFAGLYRGMVSIDEWR
ncbi:MAG: UGSC family (seleno)protein [Rhodospirillales bacterium]|jgi:hypothetical protein|nr:UGSC family (seleno)protein [Rhodospirillales bacterium]MDP6646354.1 UGSC family (seleno)protein [Rhodospirillales bacterium]MDP6842087.1 UGSC family (seleno)protein [Rhodospirillales bacterium]